MRQYFVTHSGYVAMVPVHLTPLNIPFFRIDVFHYYYSHLGMIVFVDRGGSDDAIGRIIGLWDPVTSFSGSINPLLPLPPSLMITVTSLACRSQHSIMQRRANRTTIFYIQHDMFIREPVARRFPSKGFPYAALSDLGLRRNPVAARNYHRTRSQK